MERTIIISLGGSLIVPDEIDISFLKKFRDLIVANVEKGTKFVLITGGGKVCRRYQSALGELRDTTIDDLDWMGIATTHANAKLVQLMLKEHANNAIIIDPTLEYDFSKPVTVAGGWKPGWSTDYDAVQIAIKTGAKQIINLSNIDYAYDSDPRTNPDAKKLEQVTWEEYRGYIPADWNAGLSTPFDPIASKAADEGGIEVAIMNGANIDNLQDYLDNKPFLGTVIK
jgi:uridylate kinase